MLFVKRIIQTAIILIEVLMLTAIMDTPGGGSLRLFSQTIQYYHNNPTNEVIVKMAFVTLFFSTLAAITHLLTKLIRKERLIGIA